MTHEHNLVETDILQYRQSIINPWDLNKPSYRQDRIVKVGINKYCKNCTYEETKIQRSQETWILN